MTDKLNSSKTKKLKKLVYLQWKIVGMIVCTVFLVLALIIIGLSIYLSNNQFISVDKELYEANVDAMQRFNEEHTKENNTFWSFEEYERMLLQDLYDKENHKNKPPSDSNDKRSRPNIGGNEPRDKDLIPIMTFQLVDDQLIETEYGIMSAYIDEATKKEAVSIITSSDEGTHNIFHLGVTFRKDTFYSGEYVAITSTYYVYQWTETIYTLTLLSIIILCIIAAISYIFARRVTTDLQKTWDNQERFIADASHDLKTPLTIILTNSGILKRNKDKKVNEVYEWIDSIEEEAQQMENLTNSMLDLAKIDNYNNSDIQRYFKQVNFSKVVKTVCLQLDTIAYENNINFKHNIEDGIFVLGIQENLKKAVTTIVANSHKHSVKDDNIMVTLKTEDKLAVLNVKNEKSLISKEELPYIFERFRHSSEQKQFKSHGLGLAIAKEIIQQHNGEIEVSSSVERGTCFTIKLALNK